MLISDKLHVQFLVSNMECIYKKLLDICIYDTYHTNNAQLCG